jgi:hypothetical protein
MRGLRAASVPMLLTMSLAPSLTANCRAKGSNEMTTRDSVSSGAPSLQDLGRQLGVTFPPGTRVVGVDHQNGMDDLVGAKVEMKRADWPAFIASTPIHPASFRHGNRGLLGPDKGFWNPNQYPGLRTAQAQLPQARALNIGFDDSAADPVAVFVVNHGT